MIVNPFQKPSSVFETLGGRMLKETFGLVGCQITDPHNPKRIWTITSIYAPIPNRQIGGIRAYVVDQKGFVSFINQRDLEVLLGLGKPDEYCRWLGKDYVDPHNQSEWVGFMMDEEDLCDDLFSREQELRLIQQEVSGGVLLPSGLEINRSIHLDRGTDCKELLYGLGDQAAYDSGGNSLDINTLGCRWSRVERERVEWRRE
jgi:hypothetical protein